ncbi:hypothetical protein QUF80_12380 [Desulfococcaceae bacterium HSG8]|nr:hypothetical protein [Desulfococcaceae bacterium HSG8]
MWKQEAKKNLMFLLKVGIPYTVAGMIIVFLGIYILKRSFAGSEYLTAILFLWLAFFWFVYQPFFRKKIISAKKQLRG